jgi:hypothetical protein
VTLNVSFLTKYTELVGRSLQLQQIMEVLARDGDLLIVGVPGSGRRTLGRKAVSLMGAIALEVDCIRAIDGARFVQLLADAISQAFEPTLIEEWVANHTSAFEFQEGKIKLLRLNPKQLWQAFEKLIHLPQLLAERIEQQVVLILPSFPHIRSWDRHQLWETTLRAQIQMHTRVSYVLIATSFESSESLETVQLAPLAKDVLAVWVQEILQAEGLNFDLRSPALSMFLNAVQGHIGSATALIRRMRMHSQGLITAPQVEEAIGGLLQDLSITFESLLMLLPGSQVHVLECLAVYPTDKPQAKEYIQKHSLSRGGSLQGALTGLQQKGLIYGAEQGYQLALPLLALWLRQRLG